MALGGSSGWDFLMAAGVLAGCFFSILESPVPSLFIMLKRLHFSLPPISPPHTHTLRWLPLQAGSTPGKASWQGSVLYRLCCVPDGKSVGGMEVLGSHCLLPMPHRVEVGRALCVYGLPVLYCGSLEGRSAGIFPSLHCTTWQSPVLSSSSRSALPEFDLI